MTTWPQNVDLKPITVPVGIINDPRHGMATILEPMIFFWWENLFTLLTWIRKFYQNWALKDLRKWLVILLQLYIFMIFYSKDRNLTKLLGFDSPDRGKGKFSRGKERAESFFNLEYRLYLGARINFLLPKTLDLQ